MDDERFAAVRGAWPKVSVTKDTFTEHLSRHGGDGEALHTSDLYLACGVLQRDAAALVYFEEQFMARVPDYVLRLRVARDVVEDVQQKLRETLILGGEGKTPKIAEYSGKGALGGWLRIAAVRTALNRLRGAKQESRNEALGDEISLAADPELAYVKEHAQQLFADAFRRVLADLDESGRTILRLHYIEGLTMDQLAKVYNTPRSTIARRVAEARQKILEATESLLRDSHGLSPSAVASVIREAKSRLDVTITRLLG